MPGDGPTWLGGYASLPDESGTQRLVAVYSKIKPPLAEYERGLCVWNERDKKFERLKVLWKRSATNTRPPTAPTGHVAFTTDDAGVRWALFGDPFPHVKCRATFEDWSDPKKWTFPEPQRLVPTRNSDKQIKPHRGAIAWNEFRQKWVTIFTQMNGKSSVLGEIWYAEADAPTGPWSGAVKVVTHNKYTFYNPQLHPEFSPKGSPILLFEATFTHAFSKTKNTNSTPRLQPDFVPVGSRSVVIWRRSIARTIVGRCRVLRPSTGITVARICRSAHPRVRGEIRANAGRLTPNKSVSSSRRN